MCCNRNCCNYPKFNWIAKQGGSQLFASLSNNVGKVNGESIELTAFNKRVKEAEDMHAQLSGQAPTGTQTYQTRDQTWNQIVAEKIFFSEAKKAGIEFTAKELSYILLSNDPSNPFIQEQSLKDSITGTLDLPRRNGNRGLRVGIGVRRIREKFP